MANQSKYRILWNNINGENIRNKHAWRCVHFGDESAGITFRRKQTSSGLKALLSVHFTMQDMCML